MDPDRLKDIPLFEGLSGKEREQVARWADEVDVSEGKHLVDEGDFGYEFFVIESGAADVQHGSDAIATLGPGDFFGELALMEEERRTASVVATHPSTVIVMTRQAFDSMAREMPDVAQRIRDRVAQYRR
jgi:CRP/FNR family transcriptional regulator, cyclic AMP receptor protein